MLTQQDGKTIRGFIAISGELTVRTADGKLVTLRSMTELLQARQVIHGEVASTAQAAHAYPRYQLADFSD